MLINLAAIGITFLTLTGGAYLTYKIVYYEDANPSMRSIYLEGVGKVDALPDIAEVQIGVVTQGKNISEIAKENTEKMNTFTTAMKELGIKAADLQTKNYSIQPEYVSSEDKAPTINGYRIEQMLAVKVRDLTKVQDVLLKAVALGSNSVNGPVFTVDDESVLLEKAREKALEDIAKKVKTLEKTMGMKIGKLTSYNEWPETPCCEGEKGGGGFGGMGLVAMESTVEIPSPNIQPGSVQKIMHVNINYELD